MTEVSESSKGVPFDKHGRITYAALSRAGMVLHDPMEPFVADPVKWPDGAPFAACASHDIDRFQSMKIRMYQAYRGARSGKVVSGIMSMFGGDRTTISNIIAIDESLGIPSTFYLMTNEYDLSDDYLSDIRSAADKGFEFGLHASYDAHLSVEELHDQRYKLEKFLGRSVVGVRHHYLRFEFPTTWVMQSVLFDYDSTYAFPDHIGYRGGNCIPFDTGRGIWEVPLAVQDVTVFNIQKVGWPEIKILVDRVADAGGLFTYLWHNDSLTKHSTTRPWLPMYIKLTEYLKAKGAWFTTGKEAVRWVMSGHL